MIHCTIFGIATISPTESRIGAKRHRGFSIVDPVAILSTLKKMLVVLELTIVGDVMKFLSSPVQFAVRAAGYIIRSDLREFNSGVIHVFVDFVT